MISAGLTNRQIVRTLRQDFSPDNSRLHMVVEKNVTNIRRERSSYPGRLDDDDLTSVSKRIAMNRAEDGFVLYEEATDAK